MKRIIPRLQGPAKSIAKSELIGRDCTISRSTDAGMQGRSGRIVDETLHTLTMEEEGRRMQIPKAGNVFRFMLPQGDTVDIDGYAIQFRPQDRTKKVR